MSAALFKLILLQSRGFSRRILRGTHTPRRMIFLVLGVVVILLWLGPAVFTSAILKHSPAHAQRLQRSPERFEAVAPLVLIGICFLTIVSSAGDKAIAFTQGEVDMLFPGPFTRRQLLGYKLGKSSLAALLTGLLLSVAFSPYSRMWIACYVGIVLTLLFIQLFSTSGVLLGQALGQRAYSTGRRVVLVVGGLVALLLVRHFISVGGLGAIYDFRSSELGQKVLAPFEPFGRAITAGSFADLGYQAAWAALIDLALLVLVIALDANYLEAALSASRRRYAQIQRIRSGMFFSAGVKGDVKWRLPAPPWLGGAGPIAWRQATSAARSAKGLLILVLIAAIAVGPLIASAARAQNVSQPLVYVLAWLTVLLSGMLKFDFRGDLDHMDVLKSLPLKPWALAWGQVAVPTLILTGAHVLILLGVAVAVQSHRDVLIVAVALALPFNALLMTTENLIFLLFPTRPAAASPGDFQVIGRQAAQLVMKAIAVIIGCVIAFGVAVPFFILSKGSLVLLTGLAGMVLIAETIGISAAVAWAYNRFDPSVDTPG